MYIGERKKLLIIEDKEGEINTIPKTLYNLLKWKYNDGERLVWTEDNKKPNTNFVKETFDDGIFNATLEGHNIQIRDRDIIARLFIAKLGIKSLMETITVEDGNYKKIWGKFYIQENKEEIVKELLGGFSERIEYRKKYYVVDELFRVDHSAQASTIEKFGDDSGRIGKTTTSWKNLCIVVKGSLKPYNIKTKYGAVFPLDEKTQEIISKIMFLLFPNVTDSVFMDQLNTKVRKLLKVESKERKLAEKKEMKTK